MRILHLIRSVDPSHGGPIEGVKNLGAANARAGHVVEVATLDSCDASFVAKFPMPLHCFGPSFGKYGFTPRLVPWLRQHRNDFDAVVVNGLWQFNAYGAYLALHGTNTPYYIYPHGMLDPWFQRAYPLKHLKKAIYWRLIQHRIITAARALFFTCEEERILARKGFYPYRCREMVVNYGTSIPKLTSGQRDLFFEQFPETRDKRCLLFVGRIHEKKGCDLLIRAFQSALREARQETADWHLIIAGPDQSGLAKNLKTLASELGVAGRITWTGMLSGDLKWGAFQAAEAFVLPSHQENFGIAVVEALGCGLPVLISNQVNIWREILSDGAGLVDRDDQDGVNNLLMGWLKLTDAKRECMRAATKASFNSRFEIHQAARSMVEAISATMDAPAKRTALA
jgi:glycosyltransferase involved in cell wall biosynthesis